MNTAILPRHHVVAAWTVAALVLVLVLRFDLLAALLAGLLVYQLVHLVALRLTFVRERRARILAVAFIAAIVVALLSVATFAAVVFFRSESGGYVLLLKKTADVIQSWHGMLPPWLVSSLPTDAKGLERGALAWLRQHVASVQTFGRESTRIVVRIVIGMVIGGLIALRQAEEPGFERPFAQALADRAERFAESFRLVVFAQVRIAAVNAGLTAFYLAIVLPLLGVHLPLVKTMIAVTFVAGLLPVIGNLVSNVVVVIVSLSVSPYVAIGSLVYLVAIHKLEYFLNARIVGRQIEARAWELLVAMLLMEAVFGLAGLVSAPIYYAYLKDELTAAGAV